MAAVYILQRITTGKFYIGSTNDPPRRFSEHDRQHSPYTRGRGPWKLVYEEGYETLAEAPRREHQLKSWKSHRSIAEQID
jgi:putative endonuclease